MMMLRLWWTTGDADDQMLAILNQADANNSRLRQKHSLDDSDGDDKNDDDGDDNDDDDNGCSPFYLRPFYLPSLLPSSSR